MPKLTWGFIGCGNLAQALIHGALQKKFVSPRNIVIFDRSKSKAKSFSRKTKVNLATTLAELQKKADIIVLAIKPQDFPALLIELGPIRQNQTLISVAAGIKISDLRNKLKTQAGVARIMANLPVQVGAGVFGVTYSRVSTTHRRNIEKFLNSIGSLYVVKNDRQIDAVTSGSASGVGFVFYLMEAFESWFKTVGFNADRARQITLETFLGAIHYAQKSGESFETLRKKVTSKKGTTHAGLTHFTKNRVALGLKRGLTAAYLRCRSLASSLK